MDYKRIYDEVIARAKDRDSVDGYTEVHHIEMTAMGGLDIDDNKVVLTAREHYLAHWLLHKVHRSRTTGAAWASMTSNKSGNRYTSHTWAIAREAGVESHRGSKRSAESRKRMSLAATGRVHTAESKAKMSESRLGELNHFYGKNHTEETKMKISEARLGKHGNPVMATCMTTGETYRFPSAYYASTSDDRGIGRDSSAISKACRGLIKSHNGYLWSYADRD